MTDSSTSETTTATVLGVAGVALYLLVGFLYLSSGLVVPMPWVLLLWLVWAAGWYVVVRVYQSRRAFVPLVAFGAAIAWWAVLALGGQLLGWTA